jgi:hypothetical protein
VVANFKTASDKLRREGYQLCLLPSAQEEPSLYYHRLHLEPNVDGKTTWLGKADTTSYSDFERMLAVPVQRFMCASVS